MDCQGFAEVHKLVSDNYTLLTLRKRKA